MYLTLWLQLFSIFKVFKATNAARIRAKCVHCDTISEAISELYSACVEEFSQNTFALEFVVLFLEEYCNFI